MATFDLELPEEQVFPASDVSVVGIVSDTSGFLLAGRLNRLLRAGFVKQKDFFLLNMSKNESDELECFYFENPLTGYKYLLLETENKFKSNIKQWEPYEFVLLVIGEGNSEHSKQLVKKLNTIDVIKILQILHSEAAHKESSQPKPQSVQLNLLGEEIVLEEKNTKIKRSKAKSKSRKGQSAIMMGDEVLKSFLTDLAEYAFQLWDN